MAPSPSGRYQATSPASCSGLTCDDGVVVEVVVEAGEVVVEPGMVVLEVLGLVVDVLEVLDVLEVVLGLVVEEVDVDVDVDGGLIAVTATAFHIPPTRTHKSESAVFTARVPSGGGTSKSSSVIVPALVFGTIPPSPL